MLNINRIMALNVRRDVHQAEEELLVPSTVLPCLLDVDTSTVGWWMEDEGSLTGVESYL